MSDGDANTHRPEQLELGAIDVAALEEEDANSPPNFTDVAPLSALVRPIPQIDETPPSPVINGNIVSPNPPSSDSDSPVLLGVNRLRPASPGAISLASTISYLGYGSDDHVHRKKVVKKKRHRKSRGSNMSVPQTPDSVSGSVTIDFDDGGFDTDCKSNMSDASNQDITLMYASHEKIPKKDFRHEVQAKKDVASFLEMAQLMLDMVETSLQDILDTMLERILKDETKCTMASAKSALFTHDSVRHFTKTIQGTSETEYGGIDYDQSWICAFASVTDIKKRHVAIARLQYPRNLGETSQEVQFIVLVIAPRKEKTMRNALETARTFSTLFMYPEVRQELLDCQDEEEFMATLKKTEEDLRGGEKTDRRRIKMEAIKSAAAFERPGDQKFTPGAGVWGDLKRRAPHYLSDFTDGLKGRRSLHKLLSATVFLYFACVLPSIAFGTLNERNTHGDLDVKKVFVSQTLGGLMFALFGGQPLVILQTTAPLALYTKIIYEFSHSLEVEFLPMFGLVGLFSSAFLFIYAVFGLSRVMKYTTRSTEEIFALFIVVAYVVDAIRSLTADFYTHFDTESCKFVNLTALNSSLPENGSSVHSVLTDNCQPERPLLHMILLLGTLWVGITLYNCTKSPYLTEGKRELLADYALPIAVVFNGFMGSYAFRAVQLERFQVQERPMFQMVALDSLHPTAMVVALGLGFCLSLLFFMDQNISAAIVNNPAHKLKKGSAYHLDLLVVAAINTVLSLFGLPWVHGALPHSPLHVRALADVEVRVDQGHLYPIIIRVRETRVAAILSHILIGLSLLLLPSPLNYIPQAVLNGLFLFMAVSSLTGNQLFERLMLLVTEQSAYPPNHYIRRVPLGKIHLWSFSQVLQLGLLCGLGFAPLVYLEMVFPLVILSLMPIRHILMPRILDPKYIEALDAAHTDFQ
ncbi:SLC4A11 [Branchiostoma lanceolatum]|uniref:SLC4A11 protein n=2 Tax=Branchiostoma lanceolatum TaxID=7740 RepID=A0A8J9YYV9_BRALA|nr:SLC4A11 [Branchiostoma lanceolatum]